MKDFSRTNYSSARAALIEAWRFFRGRRAWISTYWARPVFELWLEEAVNLGMVDAPDFYQNKAAYCRCRWIGPGRGWIDPVKEATAAQIRMDNNLSTLEAECAEQGLDWEESLESGHLATWAGAREGRARCGARPTVALNHTNPFQDVRQSWHR
jgi:capsid protein